MFKPFIFFTLFIALSGCANHSVTIDYNAAFDFSSLRSFQLSEPASEPLGLETQRMRQAVIDNLIGKGFERSEGSSDFLVDIVSGQTQQANESRFSIGLGSGSWGRSGGIGIGGSVSVPVGQQWLDYQWAEVRVVADSKIIWQGRHQLKLDTQSAQAAQHAQLELIRTILEKFPPPSRGE
ncbi:DUF4136 domain-containing protein [Aestuariibacter salexigens]|uniref:DUF4136 domain-containing protein n=1 Tax=Aestuariibacter salexigens TaxID=226010 RepID=UPI00041F34E6|nr:DUF4136 domain-containing protein [Aestuariibacter salexigens]